MKLLKEKANNGGYVITVIVGKKSYNSLWTSPPIYGVDKYNSYNFDMEYLRGRYHIINTRKRAEQFSRLYRNLWVEVTDQQLKSMRHCIGLNYKRKPYRNYYFINDKNEDWNELVNKGLAVKSSKQPNDYGSVYFWLSQQGVEFVLGKSVGDKVYKEL